MIVFVPGMLLVKTIGNGLSLAQKMTPYTVQKKHVCMKSLCGQFMRNKENALKSVLGRIGQTMLTPGLG